MDAKHLLAFLVCPDGRAEAHEGQPEGSRLLAKGHTRKEADDERGMGDARRARPADAPDRAGDGREAEVIHALPRTPANDQRYDQPHGQVEGAGQEDGATDAAHSGLRRAAVLGRRGGPSLRVDGRAATHIAAPAHRIHDQRLRVLPMVVLAGRRAAVHALQGRRVREVAAIACAAHFEVSGTHQRAVEVVRSAIAAHASELVTFADVPLTADAVASHESGRLLGVGRLCALATRRQRRMTSVHPREVVDQRLDREDSGVRPVARGDLAREGLGDARGARDVFPLGRGDRPEAVDEGLKDRAHDPLFPVCGNSSIRLREAFHSTLPTKGNNPRNREGTDVIAEELYTMTSPPARAVLAENLQALMKANPQFGTLLALEQATATRGGGKKIGKTTLGNILAKATPINLDYIEILAKVFGLAPWQMLVPGLRPDNPQILRSTGAEEEALYRKLEELRTLAKQIDELDPVSERTLAAPIVEENWHGVERRATKRGGQ